jgi:hypothetical protein
MRAPAVEGEDERIKSFEYREDAVEDLVSAEEPPGPVASSSSVQES